MNRRSVMVQVHVRVQAQVQLQVQVENMKYPGQRIFPVGLGFAEVRRRLPPACAENEGQESLWGFVHLA